VSGALRYLTARTAVNAVRQLVQRLRQPRYIVTALAGLAWLTFLGRAGVPRGHDADPSAALPAAALGVLVFVAWGWLFGTGARALAFSPAEVTWLLPAPLQRAALVNLKLIRLQGLVLLNSVLWVLLLPSADLGSTLRRMAGIWCLLSTMALHRIAAGLTRSRAAGSRWLRLVGAVVAGALVGLALLIASGMMTAPADADVWLGSPPMRTLLWPFTLPVRPAIVVDAAGWGSSLLAALALLGLHFLWVHRAERAHEDASTMQSLAHLDGSPGGAAATLRLGSAPIVPLARSGPAAFALVWKNVAAVARRRGLAGAALLWVALCAGVELLVRFDADAAAYIGAFAATWVGFVLFTGPQFIRNDLRHDLPHLATLRALPVRGDTLMAAELASSAGTLAVLTAALSVVAFLGLRVSPDVPAWLRQWPALAGILLALPGFSVIVMLVQNAGAVLFPEWTHLTGRTGSAAALGTNLLGVIATMAAGSILLLPALFLLPDVAEPSGRALISTGVMISVVAMAESWLVVRWLGGRLERLEFSEDAPTDA
jgi:ABC-2 type transport system permease protein